MSVGGKDWTLGTTMIVSASNKIGTHRMVGEWENGSRIELGSGNDGQWTAVVLRV